ncbi:kinase-like protein [Xylariaceae sp. AK1471]|nr:kinase-like protein [Xylariaceae sp. AK1471]
MASQVSLTEQLINLSASRTDKSGPPAIHRVQQGLREAIRPGFEGLEFVPNDELERLLTRNAISDVIRSTISGPVSEGDPELAELLDQIDPKDQRNRYKSRKRLLAILIMAGIPGSIIHFLDEGIWDRHLPFEPQKYANDGQLEYIKDDGSRATCPFRCFENDHSKLMVFEGWQWKFVVPFFSFTQDKMQHLQLQHKIPLPFTEETTVPIEGGYSQADGCSFAVKRLLSSTEENFNREVEALKLVRKFSHPHLIELLGTCNYRHSFYLIFRWADGDLRTFWQNNPVPNSDPTMALWVLQQCLGIAKGLSLIHSGKCSPSPRTNLKGRHGDIKPCNILRYAPRAGSQDPKWGVLAISDFGLTRFHQDQSCWREYKHGPPATLTYRAPEGDLRRKVSYSWDIWPLGCLYLEFLTWLLQGWNAVVIFSEERQHEDRSGYPEVYREDKFFNLNRVKSFGACRKDSVIRRIHALYNHPGCNDLIHDFLDLISEDLIRIRNNRRAQCHQIVRRLEAMEKKCENDEAYYTLRQKRLTKKPTYESDKSRKRSVALSNLGDMYGDNNQGDATESLYGRALDIESGGEHDPLLRTRINRPRESRYLRYFLYLVKSCFSSDSRNSVNNRKQ